MPKRLARPAILALTMFSAWIGGGAAYASGLPPGQPLDLPCVTGVTVEILGQALPPDANGKALVAARLTIAPEGGFDAHTHPGTLTVWVDSGSLGFTMLDDTQMTVNHPATDSATPATEEMVMGTETVLQPGDWLVEEGMVHSAWNRSTEPTVVILSGFVDPSLPLVQCAA